VDSVRQDGCPGDRSEPGEFSGNAKGGTESEIERTVDVERG